LIWARYFLPKYLWQEEKTSEGIIFLDLFAKAARKNGICCCTERI